jgi:hypothetical protein
VQHLWLLVQRELSRSVLVLLVPLVRLLQE